MARLAFSEGDAEGAISRAPRRLSGEVRIRRSQTSPLETRDGYLADWSPKGLTMWAATQTPHQMRNMLSQAFSLGEERIRVVATRLGGAFGHKTHAYQEEFIVCALSRQTRQPVKWVQNRADCMMGGGRDFVHRFTVGYDDTGRLLGFKDAILANIGSLSTWGGWPMIFPCSLTLPGPYKVPDCDVQISAVVSNKSPWTASRGYGKETAALVMERVIELVACELSMDPVDVRLRNFIQPEEFPYWAAAKHYDSGNYPEALRMLLAMARYKELRQEQASAAMLPAECWASASGSR